MFDFSLLQLTKVSAKARAKTNAINSFMLKPPSVVQKILIPSQYDCTMQSTHFSITVSIQMCNFSMNAALFRRFTCCSPAFHAVWGGQTERESPLCNIRLHSARVRVCFGLTSLAVVRFGIVVQPVLEVGVVGADMDKRVFLVKPNIGGLFLLRKPCSHKLSFLRPCYAIWAFFGCFSRLLTWGK